MGKSDKKELSHEEFAILAIKCLRRPPYAGIHTVWSGFNDAFRQYFPGEDPVAVIKKLIEGGKIASVPERKGGIRIYLPGEVPSPKKTDLQRKKKGRETLKKMGIKR